MSRLLGMMLLGIFVSGCATNIPVKKDVGALNLNYQSKVKGASSDLVVAIVSPEFTKNAGNTQPQTNAYQNPYLVRDAQFSAASLFDTAYKSRLTSAIQSTIEELISKRGFKTKGPFDTLDDINYSDKKSMYLISQPKLTVNIDQKSTRSSCQGMVCTDKGQLQIGGEFTFKLIEPLTGQAMLTKRIDLNSLTTTREYTKQWQNLGVDQASFGGMLAKANAPESLTDNTDKAVADAVNEFYQNAMTKLDNFLSREEIMSFQADIAQLKALKRF